MPKWELRGKQEKEEVRKYEIAEMTWELEVRIGDGSQNRKGKGLRDAQNQNTE